MTDGEEHVLEKWRRRAKLFRPGYHIAVANEVDAKFELKLKTQVPEDRIAKLTATAPFN